MQNLLTYLILLLLFPGYTYASPMRYQIDLIVFSHSFSSTLSTKNTRIPILRPDISHAIALNKEISYAPYHVLLPSQSALSKEEYALQHQATYHVLFHYSWLQPSNNEKAIALTEFNKTSWNVQGTIKINRSNYYFLNTELLFSLPNDQESSFIFKQKQRLKPGIVYYFDHPEVGMLMKIHPIG